jgi:8-oxo-dGTP diphosphatase
VVKIVLNEQICAMKKKRATVIWENEEGRILLVKMPKNYWMLPGGYPQTDELRIVAAIREIKEETGLHATEVKTLLEYEGEHRMHKVFWVKAEGIPSAMPQEIVQVEYFDEGQRKKSVKALRKLFGCTKGNCILNNFLKVNL